MLETEIKKVKDLYARQRSLKTEYETLQKQAEIVRHLLQDLEEEIMEHEQSVVNKVYQEMQCQK